MKRIRYKNDSVEVIDSSVFAKYLDNILEVASNAGASNKNKAFAFSYTNYHNERCAETLRIYYRYQYSKKITVSVKFILYYKKGSKLMDYEVHPDFYSSLADDYAGIKELKATNPKEFLGSLHDRIAEDLEIYFKKLHEYEIFRKNRDTAFTIDSIDYFDKLKTEYEPKGFKIIMQEETNAEGYEITITDKHDEDSYVIFNTAPFNVCDYTGIFSDFVSLIDMQFDGEFENVADFYKGIELIIKGVLELKERTSKFKNDFSMLCPDKPDDDDDD